MNIGPTPGHSAVFAAMVSAFLLVPGMTTAGETNVLTTLTSSYEGARIEIGLTYVQREQDCLKQYGKALEALLAALKRSGDLKTYLVVETEKNRFSVEGTVPPANSYIPALANPVKACRQAVAAAKDGLNYQTAALLKNYVAALDGRVRQLMQADQIEESKAVVAERDKAVLELTGLEKKLRKEVQPTPVAEAKPAKKMIPAEAKVFKMHHYLFVDEKMSWQEAKDACEEIGGHLVTITSKEENEFVYKLTGGNDTWIGCKDEKNGKWEWVTGERFFFKRWAPDEPNDEHDVKFGHFWERSPHCWADIHDDPKNVFPYVCEWER